MSPIPPHESYPALIPPVIAWSLMLRSRLAGLPSLPRQRTCPSRARPPRTCRCCCAACAHVVRLLTTFMAMWRVHERIKAMAFEAAKLKRARAERRQLRATAVVCTRKARPVAVVTSSCIRRSADVRAALASGEARLTDLHALDLNVESFNMDEYFDYAV